MRRSIPTCPISVTAVASAGLALVAVTARAGAPSSWKNDFELSPELEARVAAHQELVRNAGRSMDDFCRLAADTVQILDPVAGELARFGGGSESQAIPLEAMQRAYTRTQRLVSGLSLAVTAQMTSTRIDYRWLAKQAPAEGRPLLRALDGFELGPEGVASWGVRAKDESVCNAPERARGPLAALVRSWPAAPACLREALRDRLNQQLEEMASATCLCAGREAALAAVRKNADLMKKLADTRGPELARRWLEGVRSPDARFDCRPEARLKRS